MRITCALVKKSWTAGYLMADASKLDALRAMSRYLDAEYGNGDAEELAAFTLGAASIELSLRDLAIEWRAIVNP